MIEVWFEADPLPSGHKFYPEGSKVFYRFLTVKEVTSMSRMQSQSDLIRLHLQSIKTEGFPKEDLILSDFYYVSMLKNLGSSAVKGYEAAFICKNCGERFEVYIDPSEVEVRDLERSDLTLEWEGYSLEFRPITVGLFLEYFKHHSELSEIPYLLDFLVSLKGYRTPDGEYHELKQPKKALKEVEALPSVLLDRYITEIHPEVYPLMSVKKACSHCGQEHDYLLPIEPVVVKPFRQS